jgi:hypothetical protein
MQCLFYGLYPLVGGGGGCIVQCVSENRSFSWLLTRLITSKFKYLCCELLTFHFILRCTTVYTHKNSATSADILILLLVATVDLSCSSPLHNMRNSEEDI